MPRADSNKDCQCSCHTSNGDQASKEPSSSAADGTPGPWLISSNVVDFAYPPGQASEVSLDTPSPSPRHHSKAKNTPNLELSALPGINLVEAFGQWRYSSSNTKRNSAPAYLGPNLRGLQREESIVETVAQDYAAALALNESLLAAKIDAEFAIPGPSRSTKDTRPKTYPNSQSFSSRLFELELSPIFEDAPVFGSASGNCVVFQREDSAGSQAVAKDSPKDSEGIVTDSSDSSYGELIEAKTFGSPGHEGSPTRYPEQQNSTSSERSIGEECSEDIAESNEASTSNSLSCGGITKSKGWPVPSLTLTQPTPESTKSRNFLTHQHSVDRVLEDDEVTTSRRDDSHSLRQVLEEVDPVGRNCSFITNSVWVDTVESSVNTHDVEGPSRLLGTISVDEHGSIFPEDNITKAIERITEQNVLARCATRGCDSADADALTRTRKRWSLMSSLKSRSTTTNGRSDESGASVWTRFSMLLSSTGKKTPASSLVGSDDDRLTVACPSESGCQEYYGEGSAYTEKQEADAEVQEGSVVEHAREDEDLAQQPGQRVGKRSKISSRVSVFLTSVKAKISQYHGIRRRRSVAKWEGKSIPPKMV